jgi:hypothetical protein
MPEGHGPVKRLVKCIKDCKKGDQACRDACEATFTAEGGKIETPDEGGKVFSDGQGGHVFITTGGKVF